MSAARLPGLDLARFVAVTGMVLVHARSDLTGDPSAAAAPWLELVQGAATNRARLLFFLVAGVGVALLARRGRAGPGVLLRRAAFLTVLGVALSLAGWSDLVLVFYGVLFVLAVALVRLDDRLLVVVAVATAAPGLLRLAADPAADDTLTNVLLVVGEVVPLFCLGLVVGRRDLGSLSVLRALVVTGLALALPGLLLLAARGGLDVSEVDGRLEPAAALVSTTGLCLLVLAACLALVPTGSARLAPLVAAGSMPLTAYVGHALLFPLLARVSDWDLGTAIAVASGYLGVVVLAARPWRTRYGSGPLEAALRRASQSRAHDV